MFITVNGKTYHKFLDCQWLEGRGDAVSYIEIEDILGQNPCRGCSKRSDLIDNGYEESKAKDIVKAKSD